MRKWVLRIHLYGGLLCTPSVRTEPAGPLQLSGLPDDAVSARLQGAFDLRGKRNPASASFAFTAVTLYFLCRK